MKIQEIKERIIENLETEEEEHKRKNLIECVEILERVIILLEDNPQIKDISEFYEARNLEEEIKWVKEYLKDTFNIKVDYGN